MKADRKKEKKTPFPLSDFLKDRAVFLALQALAMVLAASYLLLCRVQTGTVQVLLLCWGAALLISLAAQYQSRRAYFREVFGTLSLLDKPYLISEVMPRSLRREDALYCELLYRAGKSVAEETRRMEREHREYKEFIESWIHEAKVPITNLTLLAAPGTGERFREIREQAELLNLIMEKALFYARSDSVSRDYLIRRISLKETAVSAIYRHQAYFRRNGVCIRMEIPDGLTVYCDAKWLEFMLCQVFVNAVKYKKTENAAPPCICIRAEHLSAKTLLSVEDNGIGIPAQELPRIFDRGFTGSNGRGGNGAADASTGLGLYLCRKLCGRLGLSVSAQSEQGVYTRIVFSIPDGSSVYARD